MKKNNADTGEVAERFNAAVLKTVEDASPPRVRISASPPIVVQKALLKARLFCCKHKAIKNKKTSWIALLRLASAQNSVAYQLLFK